MDDILWAWSLIKTICFITHKKGTSIKGKFDEEMKEAYVRNMWEIYEVVK